MSPSPEKKREDFQFHQRRHRASRDDEIEAVNAQSTTQLLSSASATTIASRVSPAASISSRRTATMSLSASQKTSSSRYVCCPAGMEYSMPPPNHPRWSIDGAKGGVSRGESKTEVVEEAEDEWESADTPAKTVERAPRRDPMVRTQKNKESRG